jgi:hypothetical protein
MSDDPRAAIVTCVALSCRFNMKTGIEPTCMMKMVVIGETGRCIMAEGRPVPVPQAQTPPGRFEKGVWVQ